MRQAWNAGARLPGPRLAIPLGVLAVAALSWAYLLDMTRSAPAMSGAMAMAPWGAGELAMAGVMWVVMMAAMMLPSALPTVALYAAMMRAHRGGGTGAHGLVFAAGYAAVWAAFSLLATAAQWGLQAAALLSPATMAVSPWLGATLLVVAGAFQFTPLKMAALNACRSPQGFLVSGWREGLRGAWAMGLRNGVSCLACCWALMALMFVGGVMNVLWMAALTLLVLVEKVLPGGALLGRVSGFGLLVWGIVLWVIVLA